MSDDLIHPTYVPNPQRLPSPETELKVSIRPGSKLAVLGVFVEIIRRRFSGANAPEGFLWVWNKDANKSTLEIESAFNEDTSTKNKRPSIYVDNDDQVNSRTVLGDMAGKRLRDGLTGFWHLSTCPMLIEVVASKRAESATLADIASAFLLASNRLVQAKFGFHDMTPTTVGRTQPYNRDKTEFVTPITFTVQCLFRYINVQTAPLLEELEFDIAHTGVDTATDFFEAIALTRAGK